MKGGGGIAIGGGKPGGSMPGCGIPMGGGNVMLVFSVCTCQNAWRRWKERGGVVQCGGIHTYNMHNLITIIQSRQKHTS